MSECVSVSLSPSPIQHCFNVPHCFLFAFCNVSFIQSPSLHMYMYAINMCGQRKLWVNELILSNNLTIFYWVILCNNHVMYPLILCVNRYSSFGAMFYFFIFEVACWTAMTLYYPHQCRGQCLVSTTPAASCPAPGLTSTQCSLTPGIRWQSTR